MRKTILIVDDDADLLDLLVSSFTAAGFSTVTATNGPDALRLARSRSPDLIVLDLILPELDGFNVCENLRRERATAGTPIIMLTGLTSQLNRFAGLGAGANDYVMKPVTPEQLIARIELLLGDSPVLNVNRAANTGLPVQVSGTANRQACQVLSSSPVTNSRT